MFIAKLTSKGQLTLPVEVRRKLKLQTGDQVAFIERNGEFFMISARRLHVGEQENRVDGIIATLNFEGLEVSDEMKTYAKERLHGNANFDSEREKIISKYSALADDL